jgi:hypothetical protein
MEQRWAEINARRRAERMQDREMAMRSEEQRAKLEAMQAETEQAGERIGLEERELELKERLEPEKLAMLDEQFRMKHGLDVGRAGMERRALEHELGPGFGLKERRLDVERDIGMKPDLESVIRALTLQGDPSMPPQTRRTVAEYLRGHLARGKDAEGFQVPEAQFTQAQIAETLASNIGEIARLLSEDKSGALLREWAEANLPGVPPDRILLGLDRAMNRDVTTARRQAGVSLYGYPTSETREAYAAARYPEPGGLAGKQAWRNYFDWRKRRLYPTLVEEFKRHLGAQK